MTIFPAMVNHPTLDDKDRAIADGMSDGAGKFTSDMAAGIGLTSRATLTILARLAGNGHVREVGGEPQVAKRRYLLSTCRQYLALSSSSIRL